VFLLADGPDSREAVEALARLVTKSLDEPARRGRARLGPGPAGDPRAWPGLRLARHRRGRAYHFRRFEAEAVDFGEDPAVARARLAHALEAAKAELETLQSRFSTSAKRARAPSSERTVSCSTTRSCWPSQKRTRQGFRRGRGLALRHPGLCRPPEPARHELLPGAP